MKVINGHMTSKCNAASLSRGDMIIIDGGERFEILNVVSGQMYPKRVRIAYRSLADGELFETGFRKNRPLNRITGARAGGVI